MTRRACNGTLASTLKVNVVLVRDGQNVISFVRFYSLQKLTFGVLEVNLDSEWKSTRYMAGHEVNRWAGTYPVPGSGRSIPPC